MPFTSENVLKLLAVKILLLSHLFGMNVTLPLTLLKDLLFLLGMMDWFLRHKYVQMQVITIIHVLLDT